jgi:hypothetical protein
MGGPGSLPTLHSNSTPTVQLPSSGEHQSEPTLVLPAPARGNPSEPTLVAPPPGVDTVRTRRVSTQSNLDRKPRNTALVVVLTMMATLIVVAFAAGGYWFLKSREASEAEGGREGSNANRAERTPGTTLSPGGKSSPNANASPDLTPTPKVVDETAIRDQVATMLDGWVASARARDAAANISFYADTLNPYYNHANYPASKVHDERERVYQMYTTLDIELTELKVTPDPSGETATATFDKTWTFERPGKYTSGSVRSQVWLARRGGGWVITGEKDVKVYYLNR